MNLDLVPLGWLHSLACLVALAAGAMAFGTRKGAANHRLVGRIYVVSMLVLNISALGIYRLGVFFFPHVLAIVTLVAVGLGWAAARTRWPRPVYRHIHLTGMIVSYYMLIGGGVNEVFLRIDALHVLLNQQGPQLIGMVHGSVMLVFLILLVGWNLWEIARRFWRRRPARVAA